SSGIWASCMMWFPFRGGDLPRESGGLSVAGLGVRRRNASVGGWRCGESFGGTRQQRVILDNAPGALCGARIDRQRIAANKKEVAFQADVEATFDGGKLGEQDVAEFRVSHPEVAQAEQPVMILRVHFGQQPCGCPARIEEFHDRNRVDLSSG